MMQNQHTPKSTMNRHLHDCIYTVGLQQGANIVQMHNDHKHKQAIQEFFEGKEMEYSSNGQVSLHPPAGQ